MKLQELKKEIEQYQYFEDTNIIDVALASIIATRLQLGNPIWLIIIGPSSGGKSQILRPLALTDEKFLHRIDDLTENTFLSGSNQKGGEVSLLQRIGPKGIMVVSDLTVLFSKSAESRATILSQFRMIYDGEMTKHSGSSFKPIKWKGSLGVLAGSTPSIYSHFEEVADMGERFIYWRMKDYSDESAIRLALGRTIFDRDLDVRLADLYSEYIKEVVMAQNSKEIKLTTECNERIIKISMFAERVRTTVHVEWDKTVSRIPVPAKAVRVALQLTAMAKGLLAMRRAEFGDNAELGEIDYQIIDWCGYSLANEEKRACLKVLAGSEFDVYFSTQIVADAVGLDTSIIKNILQNLASVGIIKRTANNSGDLTWAISDQNNWQIVRRMEGIKTKQIMTDRELSWEESTDM